MFWRFEDPYQYSTVQRLSSNPLLYNENVPAEGFPI